MIAFPNDFGESIQCHREVDDFGFEWQLKLDRIVMMFGRDTRSK